MNILIRVQRKVSEDQSGEAVYEDIGEFSFNTEDEANEFVERIWDVVPD